MKLSEAMMLGEIAIPRNDGRTWFGSYPDWKSCGCAMGRAYIVAGGEDCSAYIDCFTEKWPWLNVFLVGDVSTKFSALLQGKFTFEQLVDYVRSIEPACGECNRFDCTCKAEDPAASLVSMEVAR